MNSFICYFSGKDRLPLSVFNPYFILFRFLFFFLKVKYNISQQWILLFFKNNKKRLNNNHHPCSSISMEFQLIQVTFSVTPEKEAFSCEKLCLERSIGLDQHFPQKTVTLELKWFSTLRVGFTWLKYISCWLLLQWRESHLDSSQVI